MAQSPDTLTGNNSFETSPYGRGQITEDPDGQYKSPKNIINSQSQARAYFWKWRTEHLKRIELYASIEGLIAGNPPYAPQTLKAQNLSHVANFNTLDARSLYERGALAYWNLLNQAEVFFKIKLNLPGEPQSEDWASIMARHLDYVVRTKWSSFYSVMGVLMGQLVKLGISPILFTDERDFRFKVIELNKFYIPDQTQSDVAFLTNAAVESIFTVQYLWECYEASVKMKPEDSPWNAKNLGRFLVMVANQNVKDRYNIIDVMDLQRRLQNGDLTFDQTFADTVRLVSLFQVEYDNKVSHYMFHRDITDVGGFLYFVDRQYKELSEALVIFTASPGEFTIHSNRGLGVKIFSISQAKMQLDCSIVDGARWASTLLIKSPSTGVKDVSQIRFNPGSVTNMGSAEFVPNNLGGNLQELISTSQYLANMLQFNTANSGDDPSQPDKNVGSVAPSQARMQAIKEFGILKHNIAHFYSQLDRVVANMFSKIYRAKPGYPCYDEFTKVWKERCLADGVPAEIFAIDSMGDSDDWGLPDKIEVSATRAAGSGSQLAHLMGLQELDAIKGSFGPKEELAYKKQFISATMGPDYIEEFTQDDGDSDDSAGGSSLAGLENNTMQEGKSPIFSKDNEQRSHIAVHLALGNETVKGIQQGQLDAVQGDQVFSQLMPHLMQHFQFLESNPFAADFIAGVKGPVMQLQKYSDLNRKNAESQLKAQEQKQQQLQGQQQQQLSDASIKNTQMQMDEQRKNTKLQIETQRNQSRDQMMSDTQKEKNQLDADVKREKNQLDAQNEKIKHDYATLQPLAGMSGDEAALRLQQMNGQTIAPADFEPPIGDGS